MLVSHADASPFRKYMHDVLGKYVAIECGGFGFATVNTTAMRITPARPCCFGRSGPVVYGQISYEPPRMAPSEQLFSGSQWVVLSAAFCSYLIKHPEAHRWTRIFERRLLPDEVYLATIAMHSSPPRRRRAQPALPRLAARQVRRPERVLGAARLAHPRRPDAPQRRRQASSARRSPLASSTPGTAGAHPEVGRADGAQAGGRGGAGAVGDRWGLVARDPQLLELRPSDAVLAHLHVLLETVPVSRTRRRRVSALLRRRLVVLVRRRVQAMCAAGPRRWRGAMCHPPTVIRAGTSRRRRCGARRRRRASRRPVAARPSD